MGRQVHWLLLLCGFLCVPEAAAQPELWSVTSNRVVVLDGPTGAIRDEWIAPAGVCLGTGDMSADGRSYFIPAAYFFPGYPAAGVTALVRIDTTTKQLVEIIPTPAYTAPNDKPGCGRLTVSPSERWWHLWYQAAIIGSIWVDTVRIIDAITGNFSERPGARIIWSLSVAFGPQGLRRFELLWSPNASSRKLVAYPAGSMNPLWETWPRPGFPASGAFVVTSNGVYVQSGEYLVRYDPASGAELARAELPAGPRVEFSVTALAHYNGRVFLSGLDPGGDGQLLASFDELTLAPGPSILEHSSELHFDAYRNVGYMLNGHYLRSFDPDTLAVGPLRTLQTPTPIRGWKLAEVHPLGPVTLVDASSTDGQVAIAWHPNPSGATPTSFEIWGARRGEPLTRIDQVGPETRRWTSPRVPPGSYTLGVVARNTNGSAPAARLEISVDDPSIPDAPVNLAAESRDRAVKLTWQPAASGAAPASYVIEGAAAGSSNWGAVGRTSLPTFVVTGAPAGAWQLRVRAVSAGGSSAPSTVLAVTTSACAGPPSAPSALARLVTGNLVTFAWQPPTSGDPLEYVIEAGSNIGLADLARVAITIGTPSFETAAPAGVYVVRLRARNECGLSPASDEIVVRVP
jgi:hypothetical protein